MFMALPAHFDDSESGVGQSQTLWVQDNPLLLLVRHGHHSFMLIHSCCHFGITSAVNTIAVVTIQTQVTSTCFFVDASVHVLLAWTLTPDHVLRFDPRFVQFLMTFSPQFMSLSKQVQLTSRAKQSFILVQQFSQPFLTFCSPPTAA